ncbi:MAG: hypothetical protein NVS3B11_13130 [Collimonas sp.]
MRVNYCSGEISQVIFQRSICLKQSVVCAESHLSLQGQWKPAGPAGPNGELRQKLQHALQHELQRKQTRLNNQPCVFIWAA